MKVYIAGPMTGHPSYNVTAFETEREKWRKTGHDVTTPFDCNSVVWLRLYGRPFNPHKDTCDYGDPILTEMLQQDIRALLRADVVVFLPGWPTSRGASMEAVIASTAHKRMIEAATGHRITLSSHPLVYQTAAEFA